MEWYTKTIHLENNTSKILGFIVSYRHPFPDSHFVFSPEAAS